jgi:hypothetical protein
MKRMLFAALLTAVVCNASIAREFVAEGKTYSALGDYRIELADKQVVLKGAEITTFVISYQNTPLEVKVAVKKDHDCRKYIVLSDKLSVQYTCNADYFGVERLDRSFEKDGYFTSDENLDRNEYFHQKVLCSGQGSELDNTRLIAAYFPLLIKDREAPVAAR